MSDVLDFYKSVGGGDLDIQRDLISCAVANGVVPKTVRYYTFGNGVHRGAIRDLSGGLHYFQLPPNRVFHVVKAVGDDRVAEVQALMDRCTVGCDFVKSDSADAPHDEMPTADDEDEEKAAAGGATMYSPPASVPEAREVASTDAQITERHPGGAMGTTPQSDGSAERWHGEEIARSTTARVWSHTDLLRSLGARLEEARPQRHLDPVVRRYMIEVMGKTPEEIDAGRVVLGGIQRAQFNQWAAKSLRDRLSALGAVAGGRARR